MTQVLKHLGDGRCSAACLGSAVRRVVRLHALASSPVEFVGSLLPPSFAHGHAILGRYFVLRTHVKTVMDASEAARESKTAKVDGTRDSLMIKPSALCRPW